LANSAGLLKDNLDNFNVALGSTHPLNVMNNEWGDIRMGAPMECILDGYSDPGYQNISKKQLTPLLRPV
jgi:hypothetical protein